MFLQRYYLVGRDKSKQHWRVLKIDRSEPRELYLCEDPVVYTKREHLELLKTIDEGNKATGGLTLVTKAYGVVGRFWKSNCDRAVWIFLLLTFVEIYGSICLCMTLFGFVVDFAGFIKFLKCYYMLLVTKRRQVGTICGHAIFTVAESRLIAVPHPTVQTDVAVSQDENR